jgi:phosphopantothenoylcysteine decarboxylase/phosphopantothenate--cysteine ligase
VSHAAPLAGRRVVVSAGPTYEDIDPVRYIGNRSSGKMGFAIAEAAARAGADVALVAGPVHLDTPRGVARIDVRSAAQLRGAVLAALPADAYVGAAAVADWTPRDVAPHKLKKRDSQDTLSIELMRTPDVLAEVASHATLRPRLVVGFAAETERLEANARTKLERKRVDLVAANLVGTPGTGFESDDNALAVFGRDGSAWRLGPAPKRELADALVQLIAERLA